MLNDILEYLTHSQMEYLTIHLRNLISFAVQGEEINDTAIRQELLARDRFIKTYRTKYHIDNNNQKMLIDYYEKIAMPSLKMSGEQINE